jgi:hypothetical protein
MSQQLFVKPNEGRRPRHKDTTQPILAAGEMVIDGPWVRRLLRAGDLLLFVGISTPFGDLKLDDAEKAVFKKFEELHKEDPKAEGDFILCSKVVNGCLSKGYLAAKQPQKPEQAEQKAKKSTTKKPKATH